MSVRHYCGIHWKAKINILQMNWQIHVSHPFYRRNDETCKCYMRIIRSKFFFVCSWHFSKCSTRISVLFWQCIVSIGSVWWLICCCIVGRKWNESVQGSLRMISMFYLLGLQSWYCEKSTQFYIKKGKSSHGPSQAISYRHTKFRKIRSVTFTWKSNILTFIVYSIPCSQL